jgi:hypothetical protein
MRFFENGPRIPDALLEERDNGNVVFFCGAGVSRPAGLPGFLGLAEQVMAKLGAPADAKSRLLLNGALQGAEFAPPLDQIFQRLQQEYGVALVEDTVNALLDTSQDANVENHSIVLRLSQNAARQPQVVTTNFDLLFEIASKGLATYVPPGLPELTFEQRLNGVVYLHGRRSTESSGGRKQYGLILSSADFGRAYLADGWATKFVRDLLRNYVIVLVGYSASDPPVRYLLEGLHSRGDENTAVIYAFDAGTEADVQERWRDRGVHALAYPVEDHTHQALWNTLRAWAERSDDPAAWRRSVCDLARRGPRTLAPYQRGQVASLIRTSAGAKLFAEGPDSPPAEWLCVFDKYTRYANPRRAAGSEPEYDPLDHYGLDDDPPRPPTDGNHDVPGEDFIGSNQFDDLPNNVRRLAGTSDRWGNPLPSRLFYISRWLCNRLDDPALMWWASGYRTLHPTMLLQIELEFERRFSSRSELARHAWTVLLDKFRHAPEDHDDFGWYRFAGKLKSEGWTKLTLRGFADVIQPHLVSQRPWSKNPFPADSEAKSLNDIGRFEVHFPPADVRNLVVPSEHLVKVYMAARRAMETASELLEEIGTIYWQTSTLHTEQKGDERYLDGSSIFLHWIAALFDRLAVEQPDVARGDLARWPKDDSFFFDKLKLWAWMKADIFDGDTVTAGLIGFSDDSFWDPHHRRELLHLLRARWPELSSIQREQIEARILGGRPAYSHEEDDSYVRLRSVISAEILGWLEQHNCQLSNAARDRLPELRKAHPQWQPSWDATADDSREGRSGWIKTESSPAVIIDTPISQLAQAAERNTTQPFGEFVRYEPFAGLTKQRPARALAALAYEARHNRYPAGLWQTVLSNWPETVGNRLRWLAARRIARLPAETVSELRFYVPDWMKGNLPALAKLSLPETLKLWDAVIDALWKGGTETTKSGLGDVTIAGVPQNRSRRTYEHAINSPIGRMTETLFEMLGDQTFVEKAGLPIEFQSRLQRLLSSPGEGADHAILEMTVRLRWLHYVDPSWVTDRLVPLFSLDDPFAEPAWNGLLHTNQLPAAELFTLLKPNFLKLFEFVSGWNWDSRAAEKLNQFLVIGCYWHQQDSRYVSYAEARIALQRTDDKGRAQAAWFLGSIVRDQDNWESFGKPFTEHAWPKEARFQTSSTARNFVFLAEYSGDDFPDVVKTILPLVVPVPHLSLLSYRVKKEEGEEGPELAVKYPEPMLALLDRLVPEMIPGTPLDLAETLNMIANAAPPLRQDPRWRRLDKLVN